MYKLLLFVLFITVACNWKEPIDLHERVKEFDANNGKAVQAVCDSLMAAMGRNNTYILVLPKDEQDAYFKKVDSFGKIGDRFEPSYLPSKPQVEYLKKIGVRNLHYLNQAEVFFAHLDPYYSNDSTIIMYLYYGSKALSLKKAPFFSAGKRIYKLAKNTNPK
jgi:hypothetical protein